MKTELLDTRSGFCNDSLISHRKWTEEHNRDISTNPYLPRGDFDHVFCSLMVSQSELTAFNAVHFLN